MAKTNEMQKANGALEVNWLSEPLDVNVFRNGAKVPRRKVRVRDIVRDDWLEQEAGLPAGGVRRLVAAIRKLARHGYEARLAESIRFVHMYDNKQGLYLSPQLMGEFKGEVLKGVDFRLLFEGQEIANLDAARNLVTAEGNGVEEAGEGVTPDPMVECPKCHKRFRVGKKQGEGDLGACSGCRDRRTRGLAAPCGHSTRGLRRQEKSLRRQRESLRRQSRTLGRI